MNNFLKEIYEQPAALEKTVNYYMNGEGAAKLSELESKWKSGKFRSVLFTGMGSSYFAPHTAMCLLSSYGIRSQVVNSGELLHYHRRLVTEDILFTAISQSGESFEIVKLLEKLNLPDSCIGITNEEESTLAQRAGLTLLSRAGKEDMTSTKTYISTLMVLHIFSLVLAGEWNEQNRSAIHRVVSAVDSMIKESDRLLPGATELLGRPEFVQVIGRGPSYSTVKQGALMFMEAARNPSAGIYGGEFRHGPMEMVKEGFRAVIFAPDGATCEQGFKMAADIAGFGGKVLLITNKNGELPAKGIQRILIPFYDEFLFPIPAIIPLQFIVNKWATGEGNEPGNFTRGAKVTITE